MKKYYFLKLGKQHTHAAECFAEDFIGIDMGIRQNVSADLSDDWYGFNEKYRPVFLASHPDHTKVGAGLACGAIWTLGKGIHEGNIVLCNDWEGNYQFAEVTGSYEYVADAVLPHRRRVQWIGQAITKDDMSEALRKPVSFPGTICDITQHQDEIERLLAGLSAPTLSINDETVLDPAAFAMERHLEDFLVQNWAQTELGRDYNIFEQDGALVGQQYPTDTGPLDILAIRKDKSELLVVELKKGRASDVVVGQVLRYMGFVQEELAETGQSVRGAIIALEDDKRIRRALAVTRNIDFYRYQVSFKLVKG
ncbi:MAG: endonuclease NucS [Bacteroidia bacterium]|nr:endonuclease NucS [Bacteroidia bacterium]